MPFKKDGYRHDKYYVLGTFHHGASNNNDETIKKILLEILAELTRDRIKTAAKSWAP